jgi:hypothetical protein
MNLKNKNFKKTQRKYPTQKSTDRVAQVVEHLVNKFEVLSSNSSTTKKKKEQTKTRVEIPMHMTPAIAILSKRFI